MIDLDRLLVFHAVAQAGSFTRAADALHLTQPGVSKHIKQLEEYLGVPLFDRLGRKVALTQAGEVLFQASDEIIASAGTAEHRIRDLTGMHAGRLRLGASSPIGLYTLPRVLAAYRKAYPAVEVTLAIATSASIEAKVLANKLDIGLVSSEVHDPRLLTRQFMSDDLVVIVPGDHSWPNNRRVKAKDLISETFIVSARGAGARSIVEERLRAKGVGLSNVFDFVNSEGVKHAVEAGLGISIQPRSIVQRETATGTIRTLALADIDASIRYRYIRLKNKHLSAAEDAFLALLLKSTAEAAIKRR